MNLKLLAIIFLITNTICAQNYKPIPPEKPRLIVGITISQFRYDYISRYWDKLSDGGIKRLATEGTFCKNTHASSVYMQEGMGHANIASGTTPSGHGIVGFQWYLPLTDEIVQSAYDENAQTLGGKFESGKYSPHQLTVSTFPDEIKLFNQFRSKTFSVSLHPESAVYQVGQSANAAYWFDFESGNFISSSYYSDSLPAWVNDFNAKKLPDTYLEITWKTDNPIETYTESLPDNNDYEYGIKRRNEFPYDLSSLNRKGFGNEPYDIFKYVPHGDLLTKDFAINLMVNENIGQDAFTDYIAINFTTLEFIGRYYGPISVEMQDAVLKLDKEIEHLLTFIDNFSGKENTLIFLTACHGVSYPPQYLMDNKMAAGYFNDKSAYTLLRSYLNALYEKGDWIKFYDNQQIYLNRNLITDAGFNLAEFQQNVADFMLQFTGVTNTVTASTLQHTTFQNGFFSKIQNTYNQKRSADVFINLESNWIEKSAGITSHSSGYTYDTHVPLMWYGWKIKRETNANPINLIDIAPTICILLDITPPGACTGVPIKNLIK